MVKTLETDARGRLSIGKPHTRYIVEVEEDGTTILTPAVTISATEAALLGRPDILSLIEKNRAEGLVGKSSRPKRAR